MPPSHQSAVRHGFYDPVKNVSSKWHAHVIVIREEPAFWNLMRRPRPAISALWPCFLLCQMGHGLTPPCARLAIPLPSALLPHVPFPKQLIFQMRKPEASRHTAGRGRGADPCAASCGVFHLSLSSLCLKDKSLCPLCPHQGAP